MQRTHATQNETSAESSSTASLEDEGLVTAGEDTIASIVTGPSVGAVAIVRVSGDDAIKIARNIFRTGHMSADGQ